MAKDNRIILCFGDNHFPDAHPDILKFIRALKYRFNPTRVIHLGDEINNNALSFHEKSMDEPSYPEEFKAAKRQLQGLCEIFPEGIDFIESNHGSLAYRRAKFGGVPANWLRGYNEVLELDPKLYRWHKELIVTLPTGHKCIFNHGQGSSVVNNAKDRCASYVQGHYHSRMSIGFFGDEYKPLFGMQLPCLIDNRSQAFDYNKKIAKRPKLGAGLIINGYPMLVPMPLNKAGRFTKLFN